MFQKMLRELDERLERTLEMALQLEDDFRTMRNRMKELNSHEETNAELDFERNILDDYLPCTNHLHASAVVIDIAQTRRVINWLLRSKEFTCDKDINREANWEYVDGGD